MNAATKLTHDTIGHLQAGAFGPAIDDAINKCMTDCEHRPGLKKARTLVIQLTFTPTPAQGMEGAAASLSTVGILAFCQPKLPPQSTSGEFLHVSPGVTDDGEPEVAAVFAQEGLFVQARKEGN